jgi:hypothetical protein
MDRVAAAWEADGSDYLDPDLAALCEAFFFSRNPPLGRLDTPSLPGIEPASLQSKSLCASVEGFSLHAAQSVSAHDREALERLLRYGLRAPFSQERLSRDTDGKVVYRLRRPWPNAQGATHLILEPLDFLRRLAALVSFPYSHAVRYHGVFANRSRMRPHLPPPPPPQEDPEPDETAPLAPPTSDEDAGSLPPSTSDPNVQAPAPPPPHRRRLPWAQLLRRLLHVDALACPRCSTRSRPVLMVVLAFLTDPDVVAKILRHLGLPTCPPSLAPARSSVDQPLPAQQLPLDSSPVEGDPLAQADGDAYADRVEEEAYMVAPPLTIRPPP